MRQMSPQEQDLFREGYASDWANRVIGNMSETRDITKAMFNSPNERARAAAVFGPAGMEKIQARMTLETIMDGARKAMGNSTTARQLIEAGLAGGALEGYLSGWDPTHMGAGFLSGAGARKMVGSEMAAGARHLIGRVDARTARNVAGLLTSDDPAQLKRGFIQKAVGAQAAPSWDQTKPINYFDRFDSQKSAPAFDPAKPFEAVPGAEPNREEADRDGAEERRRAVNRAIKTGDKRLFRYHPDT
jgi:hypothetical protein